MWLTPIATDAGIPPVGGPYKPRFPIPFATG